MRKLVMPQLSRRAFFDVSALLFAVSVALPFACCASMSKADMAICGQAALGAV